jgi:hypothetical protein
MRHGAPVAIALLSLTLAGCGQQTSAPEATTSAVEAAQAVPYVLYTHCGINEARFNGQYYMAVHPLSDRNGDPSSGWGNPYQNGVIRPVSATDVEFQDQAGHRVLFRVRPVATSFERVCS